MNIEVKLSEQNGMTDSNERIAPMKKRLAYALMVCMPLATTACGDNNPSAYDECVYERQATNGNWSCDDDGSSNHSSWYHTRGYSSKKSSAKSGTAFYNSYKSSHSSYSGIGSSGHSSGG
ncbi:hypothetical protein [Paenibacillus taiwanensis]|uniref:hypothetical protein n=1 Tax=Paenibacillus taiwanensis TaxID=401638 RepID=UPI000429733F|nr:hypothetical protein [Paenibacillus taiwanensis]